MNFEYNATPPVAITGDGKNYHTLDRNVAPDFPKPLQQNSAPGLPPSPMNVPVYEPPLVPMQRFPY